MSRLRPESLFHLGLSTPCSTVVQILLCLGMLAVQRHRQKKLPRPDADA